MISDQEIESAVVGSYARVEKSKLWGLAVVTQIAARREDLDQGGQVYQKHHDGWMRLTLAYNVRPDGGHENVYIAKSE